MGFTPILCDNDVQFIVKFKTHVLNIISGGFRGAQGAHAPPPPGHPNSFDFMQFSGKCGKIVCWRPPPPRGVGAPPGEILDPPLIIFII